MKSVLHLPLVLLFAALLPAIGSPQSKPAILVKVEKDTIDFSIGNSVVTRYHTKDSWPRPFFWPLNAPNGAETTRAWPVGKAVSGEETDHVHHRSAWFAHGDVIPEGLALKSKVKGVQGVDFWTEGKGTGKIVCTKIDEPKAEGLGASIISHNEWRTAEGGKILDEVRKIAFFDFGQAYLIVLDIDLHASTYPITFGDTKEGTMAIRAHSAITVKQGKGKMQNAQGKINEKEIWGSQSAWCDFSGNLGKSVAGVAIFDDPANKYLSCWHARDYGLMAANPFGRDKGAKFPGMKGNNQPARLAKGEHLHLRYGLLVHNGNAADGQVEAHYQRFVNLSDALGISNEQSK